MNEVLAYLKECGAFFLATTEGDQPRVRPFGAVEMIALYCRTLICCCTTTTHQSLRCHSGLLSYFN